MSHTYVRSVILSHVATQHVPIRAALPKLMTRVSLLHTLHTASAAIRFPCFQSGVMRQEGISARS